MMLLKDRTFLFLIILGLTIRFTLAFLPGFKIDVNDFFAWAARLNEVGFPKFYSTKVFTDYPPGYMYILSFLGSLRNLLQINNQIFFLLLKLPAIFAEITLSILIYKELKKYLSNFYSLLGCSFILFNPALIFNSSVWGQIDSVLTLFLYLAIYHLKNKMLMLSSIYLGIAFLIKPQTIALFPVFLLFFIKQLTVENFVKLTIPFIALTFLLGSPFFITNPFTGLIHLIISTANQYQYTSLFAYNLWGAIGFWKSDSQFWNGISYQQVGYILFFVYWIIIFYFYVKKKISLYAATTMTLLGFYFLPTRIHERYLYPAIVFLIIFASSIKSKLLMSLTTILSIIHFLNLYFVYVYYNEFYLKLPTVLFYPNLYSFLGNNGKFMSIISTTLFILISIIIVKSYYAYRKP